MPTAYIVLYLHLSFESIPPYREWCSPRLQAFQILQKEPPEDWKPCHLRDSSPSAY